MFGKDTTIQTRVMAIVKERIAVAQKEFDTICTTIDATCDEELKKIEDKRVKDKEEVATKLANQVLGDPKS
jgi:hypothetical protein